MLTTVAVIALHFLMLTPDGQTVVGKIENFKDQKQCEIAEAAIGQTFMDLYGARVTMSRCRTVEKKVVDKKFSRGSGKNDKTPPKGW